MTLDEFREAMRQNDNSARGLNFSNINLAGAKLDGMDLSGGVFDSANMAGASLISCDLRRASLRRVDLSGAKLWYADLRDANLRHATLEDTDFLDAKLKRTSFGRRSLGRSTVQEQSGHFREANFVYQALRQNFSTIGRHDDASWAYFKERQMDRKGLSIQQFLKRHKIEMEQSGDMSTEGRAGAIFKYLTSTSFEWLSLLTKELFWGYGERPLRTAYLAIIIVLFFALLYGVTGSFEAELSRLDLFLYSFSAFVGMEHGWIRAQSSVAIFLTSLEAAAGITILAMLLFVVAQRIVQR